MIKADLTASQAQSCIELMRQGLKLLIDGPNPDGAVDAYVQVRDALIAGQPKPSMSPESPENG